MGKKGIEIVEMNVKEVIAMLNKAYADEWLAYYQYWIGGTIAQGAMRGAVVPELFEHAKEELEHAGMLAERIIQLGGTPLTSPQAWMTERNCPYAAPDNTHVQMILEQNITGERCAISIYKKMYDIVRDKDPITAKMVLKILEDEVEHEEDLQALQEDFQIGMAKE